MTFPITAISTTNLSSGSGDPSLARVDLLTAVEYINTIIDERNTANGVVVLQGDGTIAPTLMPTAIRPNTLTLGPTSTVVKIEDLLRLQSIPKLVLMNLTSMTTGDIALCSDADAGGPALCFYDGTHWRFMPISGWSTVA